MSARIKLILKRNSVNTQRRLPTGGYTSELEPYCNAWRELSDKIERILDVKVLGYDPDLLIQKIGSARSQDLPTWIALKIVELATTANKIPPTPHEAWQDAPAWVTGRHRMDLPAGTGLTNFRPEIAFVYEETIKRLESDDFYVLRLPLNHGVTMQRGLYSLHCRPGADSQAFWNKFKEVKEELAPNASA